MWIVGIDPGKKGGIAFIPIPASVESESVEALSMVDAPTMAELFSKRKNQIHRVFVEKQHPYSKQGLVSTGTLMQHYGEIIGILTALRIPFEEIPPQRWQAYIHGSKHKKRPRAEKKRASIRKAKSLFPFCKFKGDGEAEALLIAEYGRRLLSGAGVG